MRSKFICAALTLCISGMALAQRGVRIGYVDMEYILENVEEYREASDQLDNKVLQWKSEVEERQRAIDQQKKDLQAERVLLTDELIAEREEEIAILENELLDYQQDRFGPNGDLVLQKQRLIQPIQDQVFNEVQKIGANKSYDFIFDKSADVVMLYSEKRHDISDLVLRSIARTRRVSSPPQQRNDRLEDFEAEEAEEPVSEALIERQQRAEEAAEARAREAEDYRAQQLKLREERKKAYEARRQKLLEEREARRKAREEERQNATEQAKDTITDN
ncbi:MULTISPECIES: OmpH family outer membrane protein [Robiginitalea]|uniref:Outer membrane protein OmpH, putative n=1 Tax=Robiginitalea biformata (strain ATCC BAA-864 / DSM 15991 / KCTC 12146 / HTCC2501) TaxID=313596 RepID=A4CPT9_ROBBH|nr:MULTISPECIES: OmpH family outer membrane protein [Robiginitalea]EAR14410.1 outer membrane protein OmpH, putative [Robiginitalea biformata HTCC2501]MDC6354506.1 OmpH family outer membrane protein [Robiginitalea sp. PM2]MDC6374812.1 OmpH family outer membrane protein [Robiginitalea sp. SP8]